MERTSRALCKLPDGFWGVLAGDSAEVRPFCGLSAFAFWFMEGCILLLTSSMLTLENCSMHCCARLAQKWSWIGFCIATSREKLRYCLWWDHMTQFLSWFFHNLISFVLLGFDLDVCIEWMLGNSNSITDCSQDSFTGCRLHLLFTYSHSSSLRDGGFRRCLTGLSELHFTVWHEQQLLLQEGVFT